MTLGGEAGALVGGEALMLVLMPAEPGARALRSKSPCGYRIAFLAGSSRTSLFLSQHQHAVASRWTLDCVQTECKSGPPESFSPFSTFLFLTGTIPTIRACLPGRENRDPSCACGAEVPKRRDGGPEALVLSGSGGSARRGRAPKQGDRSLPGGSHAGGRREWDGSESRCNAASSRGNMGCRRLWASRAWRCGG